ncbi:MAG: hypothetical protein ACEQSA_01545 [Weeksellaceae bacterium]
MSLNIERNHVILTPAYPSDTPFHYESAVEDAVAGLEPQVHVDMLDANSIVSTLPSNYNPNDLRLASLLPGVAELVTVSKKIPFSSVSPELRDLRTPGMQIARHMDRLAAHIASTTEATGAMAYTIPPFWYDSNNPNEGSYTGAMKINTAVTQTLAQEMGVLAQGETWNDFIKQTVAVGKEDIQKKFSHFVGSDWNARLRLNRTVTTISEEERTQKVKGVERKTVVPVITSKEVPSATFATRVGDVATDHTIFVSFIGIGPEEEADLGSLMNQGLVTPVISIVLNGEIFKAQKQALEEKITH